MKRPLFFLMILIVFLAVFRKFAFKEKNEHQWVAVGSGDVALAISGDGKRWTGIEGIFGTDVIGTCYDVVRGEKGRWVAVGDDEDTSNIWYSDDSQNWFEAESGTGDISGPFGSGYAKSVFFSGGKWVATGLDADNIDNSVWWSENGKLWIPAEVTFENEGRVVTNQNNIWLVGGAKKGNLGDLVWYSSNGIDWDVSSFPDTGPDSYIDSFFFHKNLWLAGGYGANDSNIWWSNDNGKSWNNATGYMFGSTGGVQNFVYRDNRYYAVGDAGSDKKIIISDDGKNWTEEALPVEIESPSEGIYMTTINDDIFAVGQVNGDGGYIVESGGGWDRYDDDNFGMVNDFWCIARAKGTYVLAGSTPDGSDMSLFYSSTAGQNSWTPVKDNPFGNESTVYKVVYA